MCEGITLEVGTISTQLADALEARPLGSESFIPSAKFY